MRLAQLSLWFVGAVFAAAPALADTRSYDGCDETATYSCETGALPDGLSPCGFCARFGAADAEIDSAAEARALTNCVDYQYFSTRSRATATQGLGYSAERHGEWAYEPAQSENIDRMIHKVDVMFSVMFGARAASNYREDPAEQARLLCQAVFVDAQAACAAISSGAPDACRAPGQGG